KCAAGDPDTDEADENQTASDGCFKLAVEIFLRRQLVAEDFKKLSLIVRRVTGEQFVLVVDTVRMGCGNPELRAARGFQSRQSLTLILRHLRAYYVRVDRIVT